MLTIGSLFSGIGGLELGLEWAGLGPVLWQVEKEPFCRTVLAKHYPEARRFDDVCTVGVSVLEPVDLICGGFPCQDVSSAGGRAGLSGARSGLWYEFARILGEMRPRWVVVENVASGAALWVDAVRGNLEELGYASLPVPVSARDVGAPHLRKRVFLVAHVDAEVGRSPNARDPLRARREGATGGGDQGRTQSSARSWRSPIPGVLRVADGVSSRLDRSRSRIAGLGNSVVPQCAEVVGHVIRQLAGAA